MNTKKLMVSFSAIAIVLFLAAFASAATSPVSNGFNVMKVNGVEFVSGSNDVSVIAGETLTVEVLFTSIVNASNVRFEAEVSGTKVEVSQDTRFFDIEAGKRYLKTVSLTLPYELKDQVSDDLELNLRVWNSEFETTDSATLRIQRVSYNADVVSISADQVVNAGDLVPVDVVVKNIGYNKLDDLYVKVSMPELGLEKTAYFGDIVALENSDDDDYVRGKFYLKIPYEAPEGIYAIEVTAKNSDVDASAVKQMIVKNDFSSGNIIVTNFREIASAGEKAEYSMLLVNPTNQLKVYRIVTPEDTNSNLHVSSSSQLISVPAGLSKPVTVYAEADKQGEYTFDVKVLSGDNPEGVVNYSLNAEGSKVNAVAVLTVILAIIFIVLLVVLITLLGKKPKKAEEFGESYY